MEQAEFKILAGVGKSLLKVLGSKFIGKAIPLENESEILKHLEAEKKKYFDATHWCYALRLGFEDPLERANDDGEPKGTAGKPILLQIHQLEIFNVLVIVTRYYGGTNLGTGGLVRAYAECASIALGDAQIIIKKKMTKLVFNASYDDLGIVYNISNKFNTRINSSTDNLTTQFEVILNIEKTSMYCEALKEMSNGRIIVNNVTECIC